MSAFYVIDGCEHARIPLGGERSLEESPCQGCGVYYGELHAPGCEIEQCPKCAGQVSTCGCPDTPAPSARP